MIQCSDDFSSRSKFASYTPEQWAEQNAKAEAFIAEEAKARHRERVRRSQIPKDYQATQLSQCPPEVQAWAASPTNGLLLKGKPGVGKTRAACSVLMNKVDDAPVLFTTFSDIISEIKGTFGNAEENEKDIIYRYSTCRYLCIDDVGKEYLTAFSLPIVFAILDKRCQRRLPTILTTNYSGKDLRQQFVVGDDMTTAEAIASRLMTYTVVEIKDRDHRLTA